MLNPLLLWFLPLALVPIALHLITLYRLRTVELPTFRFLMDSYIQQRRKIKLLEFLLMLLRTLFVALIVLALSRPVLSRFGWLSGQTGRDVWIVVDAGVSMGLRTGGTTSLERAQIAGRAIVGQLAPDDHVNIVRAGEKPDLLINRFAGQPQPIIDEINSIHAGTSPANIAAALEEVFNSPERGTRIVYVLTDANRRAWAGLAGNPLFAGPARDTQLAVMNVGPSEPIVNLAAIGDAPRATHAIVGLPVLLSATVVNGSPDKPRDTVLTVVLDDQQVSQVPISMQPGQKVTRPVVIKPAHAGIVRGRFELPADAFPDDDTFLFTLNVEPKLSVVIVTPPPPPGKAADSAEAADFFIRAALASPLAAETGALADTRAIAESLGVTSVVYTGLTDAMLATADTVILADVPLEPTLGARLRKYVSDGGGLIIFPGPSVQQDNYNICLLNSPTTPKTPNGFAGLALLPPVGNPDDESAFQPVTNIDLTHSILNAFAQQGSNFFSTVRIYRYFPIQLPAIKTNAMPGEAIERPSVLLRLPDRTPALVEGKIDEGRVLLAGFSATPDWSNLPLKPEFVPILLRAVAQVRRGVPVETPNAVKPQEPAPVYITDRWPDAKVEVVDPAGKPTSIGLHRSGHQMVGVAADTDHKGYYTFRVVPRAPAGTGAPDRVDLGFAVNLDITDADFTTLDEPQVKNVLQPMTVTYLRSSANDPVLVQQLTRKREIWRTLIWLTFAVIGIEFLLATLRPSGTRKLAGAAVKSTVKREWWSWGEEKSLAANERG